MGETWNKKEREKKRQQTRKEKEDRKQERKEKAKESKGFESMLAYVDENGNLSDNPPDPRKKEKVKLEDIQIGIPKLEDRVKESPVHTGAVTFFNEAKGFGFILQDNGAKIFFHINQATYPVHEGDLVTYTVEKGPRGLNAVGVAKKL